MRPVFQNLYENVRMTSENAIFRQLLSGVTLLVALLQKEALCGIKINYPLGWKLIAAKAVPIES